jgi:hypothetical protein
VAYEAWAASHGNHVYNTYRIWGKMDPHAGIAETPSRAIGTPSPIPSHVRGVLYVGAIPGQSRISLLDIAGRKALNLHPGPNDVSGLAAGVYFVRGPGLGDGRREEVSKVVIQR